jgi:hypothetical protein
MKKVFLIIIATFLLYGLFAQQGNCIVSATDKPWIVLNGQMVTNVYPNTAGSGISDYILSVKSSNPGAVMVVKTEEMETLSRTQTINGLSRWVIRYKSNRARTIYTVVISCGCLTQAYQLAQPVILSASPASPTTPASGSTQ